MFFFNIVQADIVQFVNNSGFMFEAAASLHALIVFAEHRYYGKSNPFGDEYALGKGYNISFLTVEQAMQDFNTTTQEMRTPQHSQWTHREVAGVRSGVAAPIMGAQVRPRRRGHFSLRVLLVGHKTGAQWTDQAHTGRPAA